MTKRLVLSNGTEWRHLGEITKIFLWLIAAILVGWFLGTTFLGGGENILLAFIVEGVRRQPTLELVVLGFAIIGIAWVVYRAVRRDRQMRGVA